MSRNALFVLLVAIAGLAAFIVAQTAGSPDGTPRPEDSVVVDASPEVTGTSEVTAMDGRTGVELADPTREAVGPATAPGSATTTVIYPLEVDVSQVLSGTVDVPDGVMPIRSGSNAAITGSVVAPGGSPASATVLFLYGPNEGRTLTTDSRGRFGANDLLQGISIVRVTTVGGQSVEREVLLAQLSTARLPISFANSSFVSGTVTDERGAPLEGAEVRLDGRLSYTDVEGTFTYSSVPAGKVLVTARKDGFTISRRSVGVGFRQRVKAEDFVIGLGKAATLEIGLERALGSSDPAIAFLQSAGGGLSDFPWYEVNPVQIPRGGRAVVEGLPEGSVTVRVFHSGAVAQPRSKNVRLYPGRKSPVMVDLAPVPSMRGRVLDGGRPVKDASVIIEAADRSTVTSKALGQRNPRFALEVVVPPLPAAYQATRTDKRGEFTFTSHPDVESDYYVTATSRDGTRRGVGVLANGAKEVVIQLGEAVEEKGSIQFVLPGRFQGLPVEVRVNGAPVDPFVLRPGVPLQVDDLVHGTWRVRARWRGLEVVHGEVVEVGDDPVEVEGELPMAAIQGQSEDERRRARGS